MSKRPMLGVKEIDTEHNELFALIDKLKLRSSSKHRELIIGDAIHEVKSYAAKHFSHEMTLMQQHHYPENRLENHRLEHQFFVDKFKSVEQDFYNEEKTYKELLLIIQEYLEDWMIRHIDHTDRMLVEYIQASIKKAALDEKDARRRQILQKRREMEEARLLAEKKAQELAEKQRLAEEKVGGHRDHSEQHPHEQDHESEQHHEHGGIFSSIFHSDELGEGEHPHEHGIFSSILGLFDHHEHGEHPHEGKEHHGAGEHGHEHTKPKHEGGTHESAEQHIPTVSKAHQSTDAGSESQGENRDLPPKLDIPVAHETPKLDIPVMQQESIPPRRHREENLPPVLAQEEELSPTLQVKEMESSRHTQKDKDSTEQS